MLFFFFCLPSLQRLFYFQKKKLDAFPKSHAFVDRLGKENVYVKFMGANNVATTNGDVWKRQRKVSDLTEKTKEQPLIFLN